MTPPQSQTPETEFNTCLASSFPPMTKVVLQMVSAYLEARLNEALAQNETLRNGKYGAKHLGEMLIDAEKRVTDGIYQKNKVDEQIDKMAVKGGLLGSEIDNLKTERTSLLAQIAAKDEAFNYICRQHFAPDIAAHPPKCDCAGCVSRSALTNSPASAQEMVERMERMEVGLKGALDWLNQDARYKTNNPAQIRMHLENALSTAKQPEGGV